MTGFAGSVARQPIVGAPRWRPFRPVRQHKHRSTCRRISRRGLCMCNGQANPQHFVCCSPTCRTCKRRLPLGSDEETRGVSPGPRGQSRSGS